MYTRFAKVLLALGIADVGYLNLALGPELFIAGERIGDEPSTTRAALREGEAYRTRPTPEALSGASVVADAPQMAPATPAASPEQAIAEPSGAGGTDAPDDAAERGFTGVSLLSREMSEMRLQSDGEILGAKRRNPNGREVAARDDLAHLRVLAPQLAHYLGHRRGNWRGAEAGFRDGC